MYIPRTLTASLQELVAQFPVVFLTGPRQSGKSTLLRQEFAAYRYVNLEEPDIRQAAIDDPRGFLATYEPPLIIDEAQRAPDIFSYLQTQVDSHRIPGSYILSGSQNFLMLRSISQSLAGRVGIATLLPLSLLEMSQPKWTQNVDDWLFAGCYPQVIAENINPRLFYANYIRTYVERDIASETGVHDLTRFRDFMVACAARAGCLVNYSDLARDVSANVATVRSWLTILEESYICFRLMPYYKNFGKRFTKTPKLYFYDTGLLCALLGLESSTDIRGHTGRGHIFENAVIAEFYKQRLHANRQPRAYYWRSVRGDKKEVDLVFDSPDSLLLYEIKAAQTANAKFTSTLKTLANENDPENTKLFVLYDGPDGLRVSDARFTNWRNFRAPS
ncbi:MAG: ATP-binding protein [Coriobacteriales bacterium]|jgi:predicted AAA+ superfamily ATPase|nr:ATP-binding protein [Coriobacteriales bacterium]